MTLPTDGFVVSDARITINMGEGDEYDLLSSTVTISNAGRPLASEFIEMLMSAVDDWSASKVTSTLWRSNTYFVSGGKIISPPA